MQFTESARCISLNQQRCRICRNDLAETTDEISRDFYSILLCLTKAKLRVHVKLQEKVTINQY